MLGRRNNNYPASGRQVASRNFRPKQERLAIPALLFGCRAGRPGPRRVSRKEIEDPFAEGWAAGWPGVGGDSRNPGPFDAARCQALIPSHQSHGSGRVQLAQQSPRNATGRASRGRPFSALLFRMKAPWGDSAQAQGNALGTLRNGAPTHTPLHARISRIGLPRSKSSRFRPGTSNCSGSRPS